jgi:aflatoxin B1 aldehyde reductase
MATPKWTRHAYMLRALLNRWACWRVERWPTEWFSRQILSKLELKNATIDTKCVVWFDVVRHTLICWRRVYPVTPGDHSPHALRSIFNTSLQSLKRDKVRVLYLHAPDRSVPFQDTVREINKLYTEGRLWVSTSLSRRNGIWPTHQRDIWSEVSARGMFLLGSMIKPWNSNFAAWEVAEVVGICKANGYVLPKIYQVFVKLSSCDRRYSWYT